MYIVENKKMVFVHMNKCAGVTVKDYLVSTHGAKICKYKHAPLRMLPEKYYKYKKIGVIRNPFSWYVSYYTYYRKSGYMTTIGFDEFIKTYTQHPRALLDRMGNKIRNKWENLYPPKTKMPVGAFTFYYINYFCFNSRKILQNWNIEELKEKFDGMADIDYMMRTETLEEDMNNLFGSNNAKKKNVSNTKPYQEFYTPELKKLVEDKERIILDYYGYKY